MKRKILRIFLIIVVMMFFMITISNAGVVSNDPTAKPGENVSITLSATNAVSSFKITLVDAGGLTFKSASKSSGFEMGTTNGTTINGITANEPSKTLGTYTFVVPSNLDSTKKYSVKFSITGMDNEGDTTNTSNVTVNVEAPAPTPTPTPEPTPEPTKSSDASLSSLSISPFGKIKKSSAGIYDITVENTLTKVTVSATPNNSKAKVISGNGDFELEEGTNNLKVVVRAEDGTEVTHKIRIIRKAEEVTETITPPNVIEEKKTEENKIEEKTEDDTFGLSNLVITGLELNPQFSKDIYEYKAEFSENIDKLEIIATPNVEGATVEVVGNSNLKIGENLITIIVKSADGATTKTYQVFVTKNESSDAVATVVDDNNTEMSGAQQLKNKIGKIILIAVAAVIAVILIGVILIINTKKKPENEEKLYNGNGNKKSKEKIKNIEKEESQIFNKDEFRIAINEDKAYEELEKLADIHDKAELEKLDDIEDKAELEKKNLDEEVSLELSINQLFNKKEDPEKIEKVKDQDKINKENNSAIEGLFSDKAEELNIDRSKKFKGKRFK